MTCLQVHLPGQQHNIVINMEVDGPDDVLQRADLKKTTLLAFFECCDRHQSARQYTYQEFPQHLAWKWKGMEGKVGNGLEGKNCNSKETCEREKA